ncbi:hypothetical protein HQO12_09670 [Rhodococcus fascians]|uniref:hypothetical protein n=1 Tax=Rhodococcoides fascians TaxID=1828 RepID=UPI0019587BC2|nr:hypothetical protein [Rhodococcus fascians]MBM7242731.1 hypothetical protein [Rhodococcus fascians]MBY3809173.1 hypothetical protein [Rhodococcus fascians]MBY3840879.1 hypothetical protein [Rhodococcus fascians]MBY3846344.1 hypothetical protein [Rhodococcus fascians]MBY3851085.1 hypothetical protein [Rhodococcus fascians]
MKRKIVTGLLGLIVATSVAGCGDDASTEAASTTSAAASTTTSAAASTTVPASTTLDAPAPAPADTPIPEAPPAAEPEAPTSGVTGEALYQQTCTQFLPSIDALEQTGISDRTKSVEGLRSEMTTAPSWSTVPEADQGEILRGLDAAGAGQC